MGDPAPIQVLSRNQLLERLAEIDALLDIMETHNVNELYAERSEIAWLLKA